MTTQNNNFYFNEDTNFEFDENRNDNKSSNIESFYISDAHTFRFNNEKNYIIKKQIIKRLGEKSNLWTK